MNIYLARSFNNDVENRTDWWSIVGIDHIKSSILCSDCSIFDPAEINIPKESYENRYDKCLEMIINSDIVIADISQASGIGVGCEIMFAKQIGKPVFIICPRNSHYRKDIDEQSTREWLHPFIYGVSDYVFDNVDECISKINNIILGEIENG